MIGISGCKLTILFEEYEGYLFGTLTGKGVVFQKRRELLWHAYLAAGGNPDALENPYEC